MSPLFPSELDTLSVFQGCLLYIHPRKNIPEQRHSVFLFTRYVETLVVHVELSPNTDQSQEGLWRTVGLLHLWEFCWEDKALQSSPLLLLLLSGRVWSWRYFISPKQKVWTPYLTPCLAKRLGRMSFGYYSLSYDQRLGTSGPKVTMFLWFTTVPSLKIQ